MRKVDIAETAGVDKSFAQFVLEGKRNPNTKKGMAVVFAAADAYAQECKAKFVADVLRKWKLNETLAGKKKENAEKQTVVEYMPPSPHKGISWSKHAKKWKASFYNDYKMIHVGYFDTSEEAIDAYNNFKSNHNEQLLSLLPKKRQQVLF